MPSCLITEPPYAERMASFFSSASSLGFPSSSNFSVAIMRSSLMAKTLLYAPVSILHWRLILMAHIVLVAFLVVCVCEFDDSSSVLIDSRTVRK